MSELPAGWAACQLSDIGQIVTGKTPSTKEPHFYGGNIPFIKPGDLDRSGPIFSTETYLTAEGAAEVPSLPPQSIVVTCIGNLGKVGLTTTPSATNQQINAVIPHEGINPSFLFHYCKTLKPWLEAESSATTISIVNKGIFSTAPISLPPLAEQTRIAQKLDELLAQVDNLKARIDAIPVLLKRFRQSVLAAAISGQLTEVWRESKEASDNGIPSTWTSPMIKDVGRVQLGRQRSPKYHTGSFMRPYLRVQNVFEDRIDLTDVMEMDFPGEDFERYKLHYGDILLNEGQSPELLGRPAMFRGELENACFTNTLIRFQASHALLPAYALFVFRHYMHSGRFRATGTITTNIAHLGAGRFAELPFPLPSLAEQNEIVRRVEQLFAFADQLEAKVTTAQARIDRLTQSILAKAFRGELVPQDPNDEPASLLLERIQAQRAAAPKAKRGRKASA